MTAWVMWQQTELCTTRWEVILYNALVGLIYCFCFFSLKEGRSRHRLAAFHVLLAAENGGFLATYYWAGHHQTGQPMNWFTVGSIIIVLGGTVLGHICLIFYYR
jgi:hypothetical protein